MMAPIFGPTLGGWISDNWSWRWIFYINVPIGVLGFFAASAVLFDPPYLQQAGPGRRARPRPHGGRLPLAPALPRPGRAQRVVRLLRSSSVLGRHSPRSPSSASSCASSPRTSPSSTSASTATATSPPSSLIMLVVMFGFFSSMVLLALFTQKVLGYDAWTSGLVLAPGGRRQSLLPAHRGPAHHPHGPAAAPGRSAACSTPTRPGACPCSRCGVDYWALAWPRFVQGLGRRLHLRAAERGGAGHHPAGAAWAMPPPLLNVVRNLGGAIGVALVTHAAGAADARSTRPRSSPTSISTIPETAERLSRLGRALRAPAAPTAFTARAAGAGACCTSEVTRQAQLLAFADDFWVLFVLFCGTLLLLPLLERVRIEAPSQKRERRRGRAGPGDHGMRRRRRRLEVRAARWPRRAVCPRGGARRRSSP